MRAARDGRSPWERERSWLRNVCSWYVNQDLGILIQKRVDWGEPPWKPWLRRAEFGVIYDGFGVTYDGFGVIYDGSGVI